MNHKIILDLVKAMIYDTKERLKIILKESIENDLRDNIQEFINSLEDFYQKLEIKR